MATENKHLDTLADIRNMMQRSSRFISLSGLSGIAAGFWALVGAYFANDWLEDYSGTYQRYGSRKMGLDFLQDKLFLLAAGVLLLAVLSAFYFTWKRAGREKVPLWNHTSKMLAVNMIIPLFAGGLFILAMLQHNEWRFVAPASLVFYGLALINASKYTLSEIRYLGICEVILGLACTQFLHAGLFFWTIGFGVLHILYGFIMWWKYERSTAK